LRKLLLGIIAVLMLLLIWRNQSLFNFKETELTPTQREIAWVYPASYSSAWERLISSGQILSTHPNEFLSKVRIETGSQTFPDLTASVPFFKITHPDSNLSIIVKWYKISSDMQYENWMKNFFSRKIFPTVIVGGATTDDAFGLAQALTKESKNIAQEKLPPLILTTASSNNRASNLNGALGPDSSEDLGLMKIHPSKTFRFGFDNRIISDAIIRLLWSNSDLKPDSDPVHFVLWEDDSYARDLISSFWASLNKQTKTDILNEFSFVFLSLLSNQNSFFLAPPLHLLGKNASNFRMNIPPIPQIIDSSIGVRYTTNRFEKDALRFLLLDIQLKPPQVQPLMLLGSQSLQARRFLKDLALTDLKLAQSLVVVTGDTLSLNTVYRDREISWPVSEIPSKVIFFSHANPISSQAGFVPIDDWAKTDNLVKASSTEELIFSSQILEGLLPSLFKDSGVDLASELRKLTWNGSRVTVGKGVPLFDSTGNRNPGTGEFLGVLKPLGDALDRSSAKIEIWSINGSEDNYRSGLSLRATLSFKAGDRK